ncbi:chemotaxis protein MotB [Devosia enhydra]|uniref:Chemotaxis protein MotB n=1 Tax=Devosia enhydra TaxID=665118 RepID=A0A1K2I2P3_9HYPH|nr:flagellar motor protein MotB [Devosia enhydra]SFZ86650.1 chemotaxis protein MotB [Devosia enhydra]
MSRLRRGHGGGGGHGGSWVISFADLMSLLMAFFVMLLSFSVQDQERLNVAAGSVQHAFGIQPVVKLSGMVEREGNPERDFRRRVGADETAASSEFATTEHDGGEMQGPQVLSNPDLPNDRDQEAGFASAAASIRQAWADQPEIARAGPSVMVNATPEGLDIVIADQTGRPMFPEGSKYPYEETRKAIAAIAPVLAALSNPVRIVGHVATGGRYAESRYGPWELSADRANAVRQILGEFGLSDARIDGVTGKGETEPFFPNDPYLAANQRVSILVLADVPPVPAGLSP